MSASHSWPKRIALTVAAVLLATWSSMLIPGYALGAPGGNNGDVKVGSHGAFPANQNDPHVTCPVDLQWTNFDPAGATYDVAFSTHSPTGGTLTVSGDLVHDTFTGGSAIRTYGLSFTDPPQPNGEWHVQVVINTTDANGSINKSKTFWVSGCTAPGAQNVTLSGQCNTGTGNYDWTIATTPATGSVAGTYTPQGGAATNYTTTAPGGTATFSTGHVNTVAYTVSTAGWTASTASPVTATPNNSCAATQTVTVTGQCNTVSHSFDWSVSTSPAGAVSGTWTKHNAANPNGAFSTTLPGGTGTFSTGFENDLDLAVSTNGWSLANAHVTATANNACAANPTNPSASASATCNLLSASLNAGTNATSFTVTEPGGSHSVAVGANGTQTVSYGSAASATITVAVGNTQLASATAPANCGGGGGGGGNQTPASATTTSTCSAASVHLDAGSTATDFTVTEPGGTHQVHVPANQTQDISYTPGAGVTVSVSANGTVLSSATAPADCTTPGQAAPDASASNACVTGITVVLSNMNGTAPATFTVTAPDGTTSTVPVNAGQLKKLAFAVGEDTTGVVTVSAPGLDKTFTYAKNCTQVLGEKHTVKPPKTPTKTPPKVLGEHNVLPFTGFDAKGALFDAASLVALGAIVCALALPRRRRFAPYQEV